MCSSVGHEIKIPQNLHYDCRVHTDLTCDDDSSNSVMISFENSFENQPKNGLKFFKSNLFHTLPIFDIFP